MADSLKTPEEIAGMRAAGAAAASVLEMITPYVVPGVTTAALNARCHRFIVEELGCIPAPPQLSGGPRANALPGLRMHLGEPRGLPRHSRGR